ncbi:MAG: gas vesicle protein GvpN [Cyanobacteria bacterium P01_A01_bin.114]
MTTLLPVHPHRPVHTQPFVKTPAIARLSARALRYLRAGYSVHLKGPAGSGKTTLAMHLADLLGRPTTLLFGDDDFKAADLIGHAAGCAHEKVIGKDLHPLVTNDLSKCWVDSQLNQACREGFTLVYDEFNRSRPEVNNLFLSALEERLLVLPPNGYRQDYVRVSPDFRVIFTSNPEEYCGIHATQDALIDRLITLHLPGFDELTQQQILVQKIGLDAPASLLIVQLTQQFLQQISPDTSSSLRPGLMIAEVCQQNKIHISTADPDFREVCRDILLSRSGRSISETNEILWTLFNNLA